jgi:hypothetical protein
MRGHSVALRRFDTARLRAVLLRNSIRTTRYNHAKFVSVGIGEHHPADTAFAHSSYEITAELESALSDVVRVVRVEVNVTATRCKDVVVAALKRDVWSSARWVSQP